MMPNVNPDAYVKVLSFSVSLFTSHYEVTERLRMTEEGYPNVELIYLDGQFFYGKADMAAYELDDDQLNKAFQLVRICAEEFLSFTENMPSDPRNSTWDELAEIIKGFQKFWGRYNRVQDIPIYASDHFEGNVLKMMREAGFTEKEFDILTHPLYQTFHQRRHRDLILVKQGKLSKKKFIERWAWSRMAVFQLHEVHDAFVEKNLASIKNPDQELVKLERNHTKAKQAYDELYQKLPADLQKKAELMQMFMEIRDWRYEMIVRGTWNLVPVLKEIASRLQLTYEQLIYMRPDEILKKAIPKDLNARLKGYVLTKDGLYTGDTVKEWKNLFNKHQEGSQVTGKAVSPGIVEGTAKVVEKNSELDKIEKGDIIICDITTPDYLHALHKVSAIVANIGGFTSHSAIVAREFGIPCIVGCGNATLTFKDGDKIRVDADKGIVQRIE